MYSQPRIGEAVVCGIDPGFTGGIAFLTLESLVLLVRPMPVLKAQRGSELDTREIVSIFKDVEKRHPIRLVAIERVGAMPQQGLTSTFNFGAGWGQIKGIVTALGLMLEEPRPQAWQKVVLHGKKQPKKTVEGQDKKQIGILYAHKRWPRTSFKASTRCRTPHAGMTDAACIAEWARRQIAGS